MPRLLILSQDASEYKRLIQAADLPGLSIFTVMNPTDTIPCSDEFDLLLGEPALISQVVNCLPELLWAQCTWAGVEPLLQPGIRRDYTLTNVRFVYGPQMSEYVFGYLLLIARGTLARLQAQREVCWDTTLPGTLRRKTLGLLGVGSIGCHLAVTAKHFGMHVWGYTRFSENCSEVETYFHGEELLEFAAGLDYLICTLPGTFATRYLVDARFLSALPSHAWLINIGRGSTLDEQALVTALNEGRIGGTVLDVFQQEPLPTDHPLWRTPNTFITAHVAAKNYLPDIASLFCDNYLRFLRGEPLRGQVDFTLGY